VVALCATRPAEVVLRATRPAEVVLRATRPAEVVLRDRRFTHGPALPARSHLLAEAALSPRAHHAHALIARTHPLSAGKCLCASN
jgi:hypothetical protein